MPFIPGKDLSINKKVKNTENKPLNKGFVPGRDLSINKEEEKPSEVNTLLSPNIKLPTPFPTTGKNNTVPISTIDPNTPVKQNVEKVINQANLNRSVQKYASMFDDITINPIAQTPQIPTKTNVLYGQGDKRELQGSPSGTIEFKEPLPIEDIFYGQAFKQMFGTYDIKSGYLDKNQKLVGIDLNDPSNKEMYMMALKQGDKVKKELYDTLFDPNKTTEQISEGITNLTAPIKQGFLEEKNNLNQLESDYNKSLRNYTETWKYITKGPSRYTRKLDQDLYNNLAPIYKKDPKEAERLYKEFIDKKIFDNDKYISAIQEKKADLDQRITSLDQKASIPYIVNNTEAKTIREAPEKFLAQDNNDILFKASKLGYESSALTNPELKSALNSIFTQKGNSSIFQKSNGQTLQEFLKDNSTLGDDVRFNNSIAKSQLKNEYNIDVVDFQEKTLSGLETLKALTEGNKKMYIKYATDLTKYKLETLAEFKTKGQQIDPKSLQEIDNQIQKYNTLASQQDKVKTKIDQIETENFKDFKNFKETTEQYERKAKEFSVQFDLIQPLTKPTVGGMVSVVNAVNNYALIAGNATGVLSKDEQVLKTYANFKNDANNIDNYVPKAIKDVQAFTTVRGKDGSIKWTKSINPRATFREGISTTIESFMLAAAGAEIGAATGVEALLSKSQFGLVRYFADKVGMLPAGQLLMHDEIFKQNFESYLRGDLDSLNAALTKSEREKLIETGTEMWWTPEYDLFKSLSKQPIKDFVLKQFLRQSIGKSMISPVTKSLIETIATNMIKTPVEESIEELVGNVANTPFDKSVERNNLKYKAEDRLTYEESLSTIMNTTLAMLPTMGMGSVKGIYHSTKSGLTDFNSEIYQNPEQYLLLARQYLNTVDEKKLLAQFPDAKNKQEVIDKVEDYYHTVKMTQRDSLPYTPYLLNPTEQDRFYNLTHKLYDLSQISTPSEDTFDKINSLNEERDALKKKALKFRDEFQEDPTKALSKHLPEFFALLDTESINIPVLKTIIKKLDEYNDQFELTSSMFKSKENPDKKLYEEDIKRVNDLKAKLVERIGNINTEAETIDSIEPTPENKIQINDNVYDPGVVLYDSTSTEEAEPKTITILEQLPTGELKILENNEEKVVPQDYFKDRKLLTIEEFEANKQIEISSEELSSEEDLLSDLGITLTSTEIKPTTSNVGVEEGSVGVGGDLVVTNESKQALRDIITLATGNEFDSNEGFVRNGDWNGEGDFGFDSNGNVVLTRYADSKEGLTKSGKITSSETLTKLMNSHGGEQIPTSALVGGMVAYQTGGGNVTGTYRIPLEEFKKLIKKGYIQFAGFGNKEFVLSPHIAKQYLTEIDGKAVEQSLKETTKEETTPTTSNQSEIEAKKAEIERLEKEKQKTLQPLIEEKEQIEKEIEEIEKNDDGSVKQEAETIDDFLKNNNITEQQLKDEENKLKNHLDELGLKLDTEYNFEDIINRIIKNVKGRFLKTVLKGINSLVGNKLKTKFVFSSVRHEDAAGQYFSHDDTIKIYIPNLSLRVFTLNKRGKEYQQETNIVEVFNKVFIHELIHAFTILKIRATETNAKLGLATIMNPSIEKERLNISRSDQKTVDSLNKIFDFLKDNELLKGEYGVSDVVELVTEALSNEGFAEKLKNIELPKELRYKSSNNNVFENIILYISKLVEDLLNLGSTYTDDNALESIAAIINDFGSSYSESEQQSFMKINKAEERAREYFKYGKSNQSDNLGSELTKLQQLKQRLAEVNKKINEVTKRFNAQIAQKQAELKALEQLKKETPATEIITPNISSSTEETSNPISDREEARKLEEDEEDRLAIEQLFTTTTSGQTQGSTGFTDGNGKENTRVINLQTFLNNVKNISQYELLVLTKDNAQKYGLQDLIYPTPGDDDIKLVVVKRNGDSITFIGAKEQELEGSKITPNTVISTSMRTPNLTWKNDKQNYHTNTNSTEKTPEDFQNEHKQRKKSVIASVAKGNTVSYPISSITRGRPVEEAKEVLPVSKSLDIQILGYQIVVFPQKDAKGNFTIEHNGVSKKFPKGRPFVQIGQHLEFLENRKLGKEDIDNILAVLEKIDKNYKLNTKKSQEENIKLFNFLSKILYLRVPEYTNKEKETITQDTPLGNNQIFFKKTKGGFTINFNMITEVGSKVSSISFDMTKGSKSRELIETTLNAKLKNLFHNIDSKDMMEPFIEYYKEGDKTTERKWSSYQDYLISDTLPNGSKRDVTTIPLKLKLNPSSETTPNKYGRMMVFKEVNKEEYVDIPTTLETTVPFKDINKENGSYQLNSSTLKANFTVINGKVTVTQIFDTNFSSEKVQELIQKEMDTPNAFEKESYSFKVFTSSKETTKAESKTEEVEEEKEEKPLVALNDTPLDEIDARIADETIYEVEDYKEAEKYLESVLSGIPLSQVEGLIDNIDWGQLKEKAILLSSVAKRGTIQHEAYESLQKHFLSPRQIKKLREEFRSRKGTFIAHQTKKKVKYSEATDFQIKEELADEYMRYHLSKGTIRWEGEYQKNSWFRKLYNLITNLFLTNIEGTFKNLSSGKYKKLRLKYNLNSPVKESKMADEEVTNPLFYNDTMESVTALLFQFITDGGGALGDLLKSDVNIDNYYNQVHDFFKHIMSSPEEMKNFFTDPANHYAFTYKATHEEKNEKFFDVQRSMYYILDNWEDIVKANKIYLGKYKIEFEDEELEENNPNKENKDKNDQFVNALTINRKLNANMRVKLLIATLKDQYYTPKGKVQIRPNSLFLPKLVDYNKTFTQLMYALAPATTYDEMMDLLKDTARIDAKFIPLLGKLKLDEQTVDKSTVELRNDFFIAFSNFKNTYFKILVNEDGSAVNFVINDQDGINKLKNEWYEKLKSNKKVTVKDGKYIFDLGKDKPNLRTLEEYAKFAKDELGIDVRLAYTKYNGIDETNLFRALKSIVDHTIGKEGEKETNIDLIITDSREFKAKFDELARIYNKYNPIYETTQHKNIDGEMVQNITLPSYITQISKIFNSINSLSELIERLPHYAQTMLYSELFTPEGRTKGSITVGVTEGIEERESDNNDSSSKLSLSGRLALDFANGLNNIYSIIVPADTKNEWVITYPKSVVEFTNNTLTLEKFINYFKAEVAKAKLDSTLKQDTKQLGLFKYILSEKTLANIDLSEGIETILLKNKEAIERDTLRYFRERAKETENRLWNNNLIVPTEGKEDEYRILLTPEGSVSRGGIESNRFKDISKEQIEDLVYEEEVKYIINIFEQFNLFFLNPNEWKDPFKRIKQTTSGVQKVVYSAKYFNDFHNQNSNVAFIEEGLETPKESVELFPGDLGFVNHQEEFNIQVFKDVMVQSAEYEALKEILGEEAKPYSNLIEADAQAGAFLGGYAQIRRRANTWTDAEEAFKQYDDALCRSDNNLYPEDKQRADALRAIDKKIIAKGNPFYTIQAINKVREEQGLNPLPLPNLNILKPAYNGITQKGNFEQHKYSVAPLIWSHIRYIDENTGELKFSNAKDFYIKHYTNQTTYVTFESANKVGQEKDAEELYDDKGKPNLNIKHKVLNWEWFGIQVETITQKLATTLGTQLTKLGILNLMSEGIPKDFTKANPTLKKEELRDNWNNLTEEEKRTTSKHYDLVRKNFEILSAMETKAINQFYKEFGGEVTVDPNTNKKVLTFTDYSKFEEKIKRELTSRDKPLNVKSLVRTNDRGQFILPFDTTISGTDTVENIINSLINKAILTPKIFGGQFPQVASTLFERNPRKTNSNTKKLYSGDLQFYKNEDGKRIMQIKLPWRYKELLGLENFDMSKIDKELLKGVGFRIPTQALNSVEHFEIVGFLDPSYGDAVMVPSEIVGKAGSDFDIDKLNLYLYNHKFNKQTGKLEKINFLTDANSTVEERYIQFILKEASEDDINYINYLSSKEFGRIKGEFQNQFTIIKNNLNNYRKLNIQKAKNIYLSSIEELKENISKEKNEYLEELFFIGKELFKTLPYDLKQMLWDNHEEHKNLGIKGSLSISSHRNLVSDMILYKKYHNENEKNILLNMLDIYDQELKLFGKENKFNLFYQQQKENILNTFNENKNIVNSSNTIRLKQQKNIQNYIKDLVVFKFNNEKILELAKIIDIISQKDFENLSIYEQNSKKALDNYYIDNLREILQLEDNFKQLVKPNDASPLEKGANEMRDLKEKNQKSKPYPISILSRLHNIVKRYSFLVGKEGVGIAASNQTLNAISQTVVSNIDVGFSFLFNTNTPVNEDKTIYSLSQEFNAEGKPISDLISMFLDAFVDIANKPYIFDANGNLTTAGTYIAGLRLGIPLSTLVRFFNQPIIIDYVNLLIQNQGALVKLNKRTPKTKAEIVDQLKIKYNLPLNEKGNIITLDRENYTNKELEEYITEGKKATDFAINQGTLLVQFRQLEQVAQDILTLSQGVNVDTSLDRSFDSTRVKNAKLLEALKSSLGRTMSQIYNTTHIGNIYEIKNTILKAFSELYFSENPIVRPYLNKLMNSVIQSKKSTDDIEKELKTIRKDLVTYLLHTLPLNYGPLVNQTISSYYPELFSKKDTNIANTIRQAQELHKGSSMFLSNIIGVDPIFLNKNDKNYQVRLLRKPENSNEANQMTADLHNLSLKATTENLAKSIIIGAIAQNGVSNTPNSYNNLIPANAIEDIMTQVLEQFEALSPALQQQYMEDFVDNYYQTKWYDNSLVPIYKAPIDSQTGFPKNIYREQIVTSTTKKDKDGNFIKAPVFIIQLGSSSNIAQKPYIKTSKVGINPSTGKQYTKNERDQMVKRKDFSFIEITLYKRLDSFNPNTQEKDVPLVATKNNQGFLVTYFPVRKYGNRETTEYYNTKTEYRPSYVNTEDLTKVVLNPNSGDLVLSSIKDSKEITWDSEIEKPKFNFKSQDFLVSLQNMLDRLKNQQQQELPTIQEVIEQPIQNKEGIDFVFEQSPELAHAVYEALGFKNEDSISKDLRFEYVDSTTTHDYFKVFYKEQDLTVDSKISDVTVGITLSIHNQGYIDAIEIPKGLRNKGLGKSIYRKVNSELLQGNLKSDSLGRISEDAKRVWESLVKSGEAVKTSDGYSFTQSQISPQQKQQAQQLYSQYLNTIFPDSKVKDIVYHGANEPIEGEKFAKREGATGNGIWFSGSKRYATNVMNRAPQPESLSGRKLRGDATMYSILLNIKNPAHFYESSGAILAQSPERFLEGEIESHRLHGNKQYDKNVNDAALFHHPNSKKPATADSADQVVVFEPEQIHILGSKQDIEGFKKFIEQPINKEIKPNEVNYTFQDYAKDNKGKEVTVKYDKYKQSFTGIITGNTQEEVTGNDENGEYSYVGVEIKTNTGKLVTANPFYEITGNVVGKEKLTNDSNKIYKNLNQPTEIKPKIDSSKKIEDFINEFPNVKYEDNLTDGALARVEFLEGHEDNKTLILPENFKELPKETQEELVLHELIHKRIFDKLGNQGLKAISNIKLLRIKVALEKYKPVINAPIDLKTNKVIIKDSIYRVQKAVKNSIDEILTYGLTNKDFKNWLNSNGFEGYVEEIYQKEIGEIPLLTQEQPIVEENKPNIVDNGIEEGNVFTAKIDQFAYTLNTISGQVTHNSKTGNKLETNETQIGKVYKEYAVVNNYETKEFNKQNYAKVFGKIINIKTGSIVTQPQIINLFNNNNIKEIKISENIVLNKGQKEALEKFTKFLDKGENKFFLLKGRAGTGKTTIASTMMQVAKEKGYRIFATAISDAATTNLSVLSKNTPGSNIEIYNFAAMYGLVPQYDDDGTMTGFDFPSENSQVESEPKITNSDKTILIFDESSMVSLDTLSKIQKLTPNITILYMGDNAQIMPIGDTKISTVFGLEDQYELTEVMRQKENSPILDIASNIAQEIDVYDNTGELKLSPILDKIYTDFNRTKNSGTIVTNSGEEFINEAVSDFKKYGNKQTLVITGNNNNVASLNKKIREKIVSSQEQFVPGERLMTYSKYSKYLGKNVPKLEIFNSSVINILSVTPSNVEGVPTNNLSVEYVDQQGRTKQTYMNVIHKNNVEDIKQFYDNKKKLNAEYKRTKDRSILDKLNAYSQTVLVDYAYAMTAHKAQGQTVRNTYVVPVYRGFSEIESRRMFYTSITRPTDKLVIFDKDAKESNTTNKFSENIKTQSDITDEDLGLNTNLSQKDAKC